MQVAELSFFCPLKKQAMLLSKGRVFLLKFILFIALPYNDCAGSESDTKLLSRQRRLIGGEIIPIRQARYQVSIRLKIVETVGYGYGQICNGALISQRALLTAAHCFWSFDSTPPRNRTASDFTVVLGSNSLYNRNQYTQQYNVQQLLPHPNFNVSTYTNDIGLMFIDGFVPWNSTMVQPIALNTRALTLSSTCNVTSWGDSNSQLKQINIAIVNATICSQTYKSIFQIVPKLMLCAGTVDQSGIGTCAGDDGAPLICNSHLSGIDSWNNGNCGLIGFPTVFTNISSYYGWIVSANATLNYTCYADGAANILNQSNKLVIELMAFLAIVLIQM